MIKKLLKAKKESKETTNQVMELIGRTICIQVCSYKMRNREKKSVLRNLDLYQ